MMNNNYNPYETTSYNSGGNKDGGGFMEGGSQTTPSKGRDYAQDTLRAVTIKELLDAQADSGTDTFRIDNAVLTQLTLVGQIRNISTQTTNITYKLDDGSGTIEVKQWIDPDNMDSNPSLSKLVENSYCRAWGKLKSFHDKRHVIAQIIRPVEDMNEVSYHLLEATAVHLYHTKGPLSASNNTGNNTVNKSAVASTSAAPGNTNGNDQLDKVGAVAKRVYNFLRQHKQGDEGVHQQVVASQLGLDTAEVTKAGDELLAHGIIYTTLDEDTWAPLEPEA